MSVVMDEDIKRWKARRKLALVPEIIQGKTTISEASRQINLPPSEIENWKDQGKDKFSWLDRIARRSVSGGWSHAIGAHDPAETMLVACVPSFPQAERDARRSEGCLREGACTSQCACRRLPE